MSSNPTTAASSGTRRPASRSIRSAPIAIRSLAANPDADRIEVQVDGHKVTLKGTVRSWAERKEAERAAWSAPGVASVDDQIVVRIP